jgi:O-antigen/teichoic acid export membrane protein
MIDCASKHERGNLPAGSILDWGSNARSRAVRAFWGLFADLGAQAVVTLSTFLLTPLVLALTSRSLYGSWQAALAILSYLAMLDAGLGFSLVRLVASAATNKGAAGLSGVTSVAFFSFAAIGAAVLAIGLFVSPFIPGWFHVPPAEGVSVIRAYRIASFAGAVGLPLGTFNGVLAGMQRTALAGVLRGVAALIGALISFVLLKFNCGIAALAIANLAMAVSGGLLAWLSMRKIHPGICLALRFVSREGLAALWRVAGYFQLVRIAYIIALNTDALIIAAFLGASEVTPYVITARMATMFSIVLADKAPSAAYPALAQMHARGEIAALRRGFLALVYYSTRLALVGATLVALLNPAFVLLWVGNQGYGGSALNSVFIYWVLLDTVLRGSSLIPLVTGEMKTWAIVSAAEAVVNVFFSLLLVRPFGLVGVAAGTAIARTAITGVVMPAWSCKKLGLKVRDFFVLGVLRPMVGALPAIILAAIVALVLPTSWGWFRLAAVGFTCIAVNVAVFEGPKWLRLRNWSLDSLMKECVTPDLKPVMNTGQGE